MASQPREPQPFLLFSLPNKITPPKKEYRWVVPRCIQCDLEMVPSSHGKMACRYCGYIICCSDPG